MSTSSRRIPFGTTIAAFAEPVLDHPGIVALRIRAIFHRFTVEQAELTYRVSGKVTPARELIISGAKGVVHAR